MCTPWVFSLCTALLDAHICFCVCPCVPHQIIYHGPQTKMVPYFEEMGLIFPHDQDVADFITEFITDPREVYERQVRRCAREGVELGPHTPPVDNWCVSHCAWPERVARARGLHTPPTTPFVLRLLLAC